MSSSHDAWTMPLTLSRMGCVQETSVETLARYGAHSTTSAAAGRSTAQLWLDAGTSSAPHSWGHRLIGCKT